MLNLVTAFPRSAGTIHCMTLAKQQGLLFADEPFQRTIITGYAGKMKIHEAYTPNAPYADYDPEYVRDNLEKFVVLSHRSPAELIERTDLFIVRQDLNQIAESWCDLFVKDGGLRNKAMDMFLTVGVRNIRRICEHLLTVDDATVFKCESKYKFNYRIPTLPYRLLVQSLVDEVYRKYK